MIDLKKLGPESHIICRCVKCFVKNSPLGDRNVIRVHLQAIQHHTSSSHKWSLKDLLQVILRGRFFKEGAFLPDLLFPLSPIANSDLNDLYLSMLRAGSP